MATGHLTINLGALVANWRALAAKAPAADCAAVVKADGYGLGADHVARALAKAGARTFFVAAAEEGIKVRTALGMGPRICVFGGHMAGDASLLRAANLTPMLNSPDQLRRHLDVMPSHEFGVQLDSGMNRLGMESDEWAACRDEALAHKPVIIMSHLACADEPDHAANGEQLAAFHAMTDGVNCPRSLAATGGILLGPEYHFDLVRPGVGLYGGAPFQDATPVVTLDLPVIQTRTVTAGEAVGYGCAWRADKTAQIATVSAGYADGLIRAMSGKATLWARGTPCPIAGRVSMDLITVDVSHLDTVPDHLSILGPYQGVDTLADAAGTIGYEILTSLGARYHRTYVGGAG